MHSSNSWIAVEINFWWGFDIAIESIQLVEKVYATGNTVNLPQWLRVD